MTGSFTQKIIDLRVQLGLSREELARRSKVGRGTLLNLESGRTRTPQRRIVEKLAKALQVPVEELWALVPRRMWEGPRKQSQNLTAVAQTLRAHGLTAGRALEYLGIVQELVGAAGDTDTLVGCLKALDAAVQTLQTP